MDSINLLRARERIAKIYPLFSDISFHTVKVWHLGTTSLISLLDPVAFILTSQTNFHSETFY